MLKNLWRSLACSAAALTSLATPTLNAATPLAPPVKVAFVYVSPVGQAGWTYQHNQGRLAIRSSVAFRTSHNEEETWKLHFSDRRTVVKRPKHHDLTRRSRS